MSVPDIQTCPGTLAAGYTTYSRTCLNRLFEGRTVPHILPYLPPPVSEADAAKFQENRRRISISGVQEKVSLILEKNTLRLTKAGEQGTYLLKPIPRDLKKVDQVPANEHLTMQIARQVYGIATAENALIFFQNGEPAYITKRFDVREDGGKWAVEDFASLAGKTSENAGPNYKYNYSYEEIADLVRRFIPAYRIELEKLFSLIVFNFLFSNGDAHLKNFSVLETTRGDHVLSPAYDLVNTRIHVDDSDFALDKGLFREEAPNMQNRNTGLSDFLTFAKKIGIPDRRFEALMKPFQTRQDEVEALIQRSYLNEATKRAYLLDYQTKRNRLQ